MNPLARVAIGTIFCLLLLAFGMAYVLATPVRRLRRR